MAASTGLTDTNSFLLTILPEIEKLEKGEGGGLYGMDPLIRLSEYQRDIVIHRERTIAHLFRLRELEGRLAEIAAKVRTTVTPVSSSTAPAGTVGAAAPAAPEVPVVLGGTVAPAGSVDVAALIIDISPETPPSIAPAAVPVPVASVPKACCASDNY